MSLHCFKSKIPKKWFFRDYNDISISSKPDVLNRNENKHFHRSQSINSSLPKVSKSHNVITSKMIESQGVFRETIYNPSAIFEKDEEDNEPDNSTTAMFYCHGKQFILIRDSCYIFKKNSKIRYFCLYITESTLFKLFVIVLVILQGVLLGFYDYLDVKSDGFMNQVVDTLEPAFISLYSIECCMKIIARGFYSEQNTYLRKLISFVDLFVVVAAVFSYKDFFRHFGILRFFRILIFCSNLQYFKSLKMLSKLLRNSFWHLVTIIVFLCVFLILFAIVGLNLYKGKLNYRCRLTQSPMEGYWPLNITETRICGGVFKCAVNETCGSNFDYTKTEKNYIIGDGYKDNEIPELNFGVTNFDNILHALIPTCQIYMIEGFQEIIYILFDATNAVLPAIYCMFLILICTFFISNMAIAAMVDNFTKESEKNRGPTILKDVSNSFGTIPFFSPSHTASVGLLGYVVEAKKKIRIFFTKNSIKTQDFPDRWQLYALVLVSNPYFQVIITMFLMVNIVILALDRYPGPSEDDLLVYSYLNIGFTIIFLLECLLKIKGLGMNRYKKDRFNLIELFVAIATTIELVVGSKSTKLSSLRALRILRIFASHHSWDGFQILIDALMESLNYVFGFTLIIGIYIYVLAIIGKKCFAVEDMSLMLTGVHDIENESVLRGNFTNTLWAYTSVFQIICLEKWNHLWYKYNKLVGSTLTNFYFIIIIMSGRFMIFNLFLSALLGLFEQTRTNIHLKRMKALMVLRTFRSDRPSPSSHINRQNAFEEDTKINRIRETMGKSFKRTSTLGNEKDHLETQKINRFRLGSFLRSNHIVNTGEREFGQGSLDDVIGNRSSSNSKKSYLPNLEENKRKNAIVPFPIIIQPPTDEKIGTDENLISETLRFNSMRKNHKVHADSISVESPVITRKHASSIQKKIKTGFTLKLEKENTIIPTKFSLFTYMKESSCLIFHKNSTLRILITTFISKEAWENFIMFLILGNSLIFALDNPLSDQNSLQSQVLDNIDYVLTSIFSLEMALKVISLGFLFNCEKNKKAYIRNSWNQLDCFVVIASILSWAGASNSSLKSLKSLRALRALRSLRMIARNDSLKIVVNAVFQTIPSIGNLSIVAIIINLVVSINTINSWKGAFHYCSLPAGKEELYSKIVTKTNCLENDGLWLNNRRNYDDILSASLSFFLVVVNEDWLPLMYASVDSVGIDMQPIKNYAPYAVFIYYALVIIGNVILMNLFVSVVIDNFKQMKEELGGYLLLSKDQRDWVEMQKFMQRKKLKIKIPIPQNRWRKFCHQIVTSSSFEIFFLVCILINVIIMACRYLEMPPNLDYFLLVANDFILILFNIECILKIMAFGLFLFKDFWDKFDFVVISASDIIVISLMAIEKQEITTIPTILRIMRLFRIVKMIKVSKTFQVIINTYYNILPSLGNIGALIFLILYIYAILGMNLFSTIEIRPYKSGIQPQWIPDFTQFSGSLLTMIQCAMLQKWDHYMFELAEVKEGCSYTQSYEDIQISGIKGCGTPWSYVYFLSFIIIVPLTVMNLFLAVVVEGYLESLKEQEAVINPCQMEELLDKWAEYDPEGTGFMTPENMAFLLYELNPPIGLKDDSVQFEYDIRSKKNKGYLISANKKVILTKHQIFDLMKRYNPKLYNENKVHFKDLFVKISQNVIMKLSGKKEYTFESNQTINHNLEIKSDYVVKTLNKGWYSVYPDLKKQRLESIKNNRRDLKASDLFAIHSIMTLLRKAKAEKKNKPSNNEVDYRIYHEYQQTNLLDKSLANKVLRTQTALTQAPIYKKRASRYSSPYKSRQTMISHSEKSNKSNVENEYQKKTTYAANLNFTANIKSAELRKTSTVDYEPNSHSEFKQDDKKKIKIQERVLHVGLKLINRLPDEKFRLKSVQEIEEDDKLFWFSYDEDFGQYPNKIKEDVQSLGSFKPKTQEVRINSLDEKIKEILSNEEEKSSMTEDLFNESDRKSNQSQNSIKNVKTKIGMNSIKKPIEIQMSNNDGKETFQIKIMPLKLLKTKK